MSSINTNASAMTALQTLAATNKSLNTTQGRISTGLRVAEASDNAAYWSIATTMRSDNKALSTVQDSLGLGASKVDTAYTGMNKAIDTLNEIKTKVVAANGASAADKAKYQTEIKALQDQLKAYADGAGEIARRSRGTPRIANRLLRRVRDYAQVKGNGGIDSGIARAAMDMLKVDPEGFDELDRRMLGIIIDAFDVMVFFLTCAIIAGLYGAATASRKILYAQALPAIIALVLLHLH